MARPLRPDQGLNLQLLETLARAGDSWAGRLARDVERPQPVVTSALHRLADAGYIELADARNPQGRLPVHLTRAGRRVLRDVHAQLAS